MQQTLAEKLIEAHLVEGEMIRGREIGIRFDQTLTQDATGTMVYLAFEALGLPRVQTELSVSYVDHNILQTDFKNADDHVFLQSAAAKYGVVLSPAGNGIAQHVFEDALGPFVREVIRGLLQETAVVDVVDIHVPAAIVPAEVRLIGECEHVVHA